MPRYHFHVWLEGERLPDPEGQEMNDADAAWEGALSLARDLMQSDLGRPVDWLRCHFEVTNEEDEVVLEFPFVEAIEVKNQTH